MACSCRSLLEELRAIAEPAQLAIPLLLVLIAQSVAGGLGETLVAVGVDEPTDDGHTPLVVPLGKLGRPVAAFSSTLVFPTLFIRKRHGYLLAKLLEALMALN